jgi:hypothetical protein
MFDTFSLDAEADVPKVLEELCLDISAICFASVVSCIDFIFFNLSTIV